MVYRRRDYTCRIFSMQYNTIEMLKHSILLFSNLLCRRRQCTLQPLSLFVECHWFPKQGYDSPDYEQKSQSESRQVYVAFTFVFALLVVHSRIKIIHIGRWRWKSNAAPLLIDPRQNALVCVKTLCQRHTETDAYKKERGPQSFHKLGNPLDRHDPGQTDKPSRDLQWNGHNQQQRDNEFRG